MSSSLITIGQTRDKYTSAGNHSGYIVELSHMGLNDTRHLSAREEDILEGKVNNQINAWEKKWTREVELQTKKNKEEKAQALTAKLREELESIEHTLAHTLDVDDAVDWNTIKNLRPFPDKKPRSLKPTSYPPEPKKSDYILKIPFLTVLLGGRSKQERKQEINLQNAIDNWEAEKEEVEKQNRSAKEAYTIQVMSWDTAKTSYETKQSAFNEKIDKLRAQYEEKNVEAITEYCEIVLNNSQYPDSFPRDFEFQYNPLNGMLIVDYRLPSLDDIPNKTIVRYVKSRDEFEDKFLSQAAHNKLFDSAIYQISLRTLHELFEADVVDALSTITFNGILTSVNPATGHSETKCIISLQAEKAAFTTINLATIDPKACFKSLKGVGSSKLSTVTPIRPILELDKSDRRFTDHYDVADALDLSTNLAAMDWEDFEHLVREIFEKEFAQGGGEVKVTNASRDGGVDAIAFDPDPIRGGKIVIQAKRYTNTVGVSAVRDLYGTMMNEGASKGILVTTADYGADSYEFAKGKPLTLLSGSNLLSLLEKHGHKAKIDIREAKALMKDD